MTPISRTTDPLLRTAVRLRDTAVVLAATAAVLTQGLAGRWAALAIALLAGSAWLGARHLRLTQRRSADAVADGSFLTLGVLLVWRLVFAYLPIAVAGMWLVVCAADLDRFSLRYPLASPTRIRREALRRRVLHLAVLGAASAAVVAVATVLDLRLRLVAVMLVAAFVVVIVLRVVRSVARDDATGETEPE
jgi:hypothetical protein